MNDASPNPANRIIRPSNARRLLRCPPRYLLNGPVPCSFPSRSLHIEGFNGGNMEQRADFELRRDTFLSIDPDQ